MFVDGESSASLPYADRTAIRDKEEGLDITTNLTSCLALES